MDQIRPEVYVAAIARAEKAEEQATKSEKLSKENEQLRAAMELVCNSIGNGSGCAAGVSDAFIVEIGKEVRDYCAKLRSEKQALVTELTSRREALARAEIAEEQAASSKFELDHLRRILGLTGHEPLSVAVESLKASVAAFCAEVRLSDVRGECGHPLMTTRSAPKPWSATGDVQYLPCAICEVERLKTRLTEAGSARAEKAETSLDFARQDREELGIVARDLREALARVGKALEGVKATKGGGFTGDPYVDGINALRRSDEWCRAQLGAKPDETTCSATLRVARLASEYAVAAEKNSPEGLAQLIERLRKREAELDDLRTACRGHAAATVTAALDVADAISVAYGSGPAAGCLAVYQAALDAESEGHDAAPEIGAWSADKVAAFNALRPGDLDGAVAGPRSNDRAAVVVKMPSAQAQAAKTAAARLSKMYAGYRYAGSNCTACMQRDEDHGFCDDCASAWDSIWAAIEALPDPRPSEGQALKIDDDWRRQALDAGWVPAPSVEDINETRRASVDDVSLFRQLIDRLGVRGRMELANARAATSTSP